MSEQQTQIYPFCGLRYNLANVESLANVTAPPYDVISAEGQQALYDKHPANVIRLILNKKTSTDTQEDNPYTRAAKFFHTWQTKGILQAEDKPAIYAYSQSWKNPLNNSVEITRKGWWVLLKLEDFETGRVLPHEFTLKGPKIDRLNLLKATKANFSPIFMIYADPACTLEKLSLPESPVVEALDDDQTSHQLQPVTDEAIIQQVQKLMTDQRLLIADGHHRYETALAFRDEVRHQIATTTGKIPPDGSLLSDYIMVFITNLHDPGLKVYPTDRVLYQWPEGFNAESFEAELFKVFDKVDTNEDFVYERTGQPAVRLKLNHPDLLSDLPEGLKQLDTAILDAGVFKRIFGEPQEALKIKHLLGFYRDPKAVQQLINNKEAVAVFYMNTPPLALIKNLCEAGHRMPQKSTYFYPKLLSGLVFYSYQNLLDGRLPVSAASQSLDALHFELSDIEKALVPDH